MGGMVTGFVIQTNPTEIGKLQRTKIATAAAITICVGSGTKAKKSPTKKAMETERRFRCNKLGS